MYRVELKATSGRTKSTGFGKTVPNVPCGVKSMQACALFDYKDRFLMYRVELKVLKRIF